jgi:hypothetical protein
MDTRWSPLAPLYFLGDLTSARRVQYCAASHFVVRFRRSAG